MSLVDQPSDSKLPQPSLSRAAPILIVDDTASKRTAMKAALAPLGHRLVEADSGIAALRCIMDEDFAVILLDVTMPGMDGFETAKMIRQRWQSEMTPIIFVTAFSSDEIGQMDHYAGGAVDFLFAPIPPSELRSKVSFFAHVFLNAELLAARARVVQETADQLRFLTDAAPIGIFQTDAKNRYVYTNTSWSEITGIPALEALGREWDSIADVKDLGDHSVDSEDAALRYRFEVRHPGAAPRVVFATIRGIPDGEGGQAGWVGTLADVTAEQRAQATERFQSQLLGAVGEAVIATDLAGTVRYWNEAAERMYGWTGDEVLGRPISDLGISTDDGTQASAVMAAVRAGRSLSGQSRVRRRDGATFMALVTNSPIFDEGSNELSGVIGVSADITDLTSAQELLALQAAHQTAVAELGRYALAADDIASVARTAETTITGVLGTEWAARVMQTGDPDTVPTDAHPETVFRFRVGEAASIAVWSDRQTPLPPHGHQFIGDVANHLNFMLQRAGANAQFEHLATHDPLTELPNRTLFLDRLQQVKLASQRSGRRYSVLFLDLDRFKFVNDGLGHDVGDELLVAVVDRLLGVMRPSDTLARFGGDEFAILSPHIGSERTALAIGARIQGALETPFNLKSVELMATASIGIALGDADTDGSDLLRDADAAMYRAKDGGRNRVELFDAAMQRRAQNHLDRAAALRGALENGEIEAHYQPVIDLASETIVGVEALARWRTRSGEFVAPDQFIELAEEIGLIDQLGKHILRTACRDGLAWTRCAATPFMISVNVSPRQFASGDFGNTVLKIVAESELDPGSLHLEITESALMNEPSVQATIEELRGQRIRFAIDDFGTGYSSLASLRQLPVDILKIDRTFVSGITTNPHDRALITAAIDLARSFGLTTIAEGVETAEQLRELQALGCDLAQGYLWSPAVQAEQITELLQDTSQLVGHGLHPAAR